MLRPSSIEKDSLDIPARHGVMCLPMRAAILATPSLRSGASACPVALIGCLGIRRPDHSERLMRTRNPLFAHGRCLIDVIRRPPSGLESPTCPKPFRAFPEYRAPGVTAIMGWAACFFFHHQRPLYHLFLADERSACRRMQAAHALTPFLPEVPTDGRACPECEQARLRPGFEDPSAPAEDVHTPLFSRRRAHHISIRSV